VKGRDHGQGKGNLLKHCSNDFIVHSHLNGIIQTWLTLTIYNTLSLQRPLQLWGTLLAEQAAEHARAFILVFAPYWRLLFALQQALSRWPMALWALYTNTCRWRRHVGWQRARSHSSPLRQYNSNTKSSNKHRNTPFNKLCCNVIPIGTNSAYRLCQTSHHLSESPDGLCASVHTWLSSRGLWTMTVCKLVFEILTTVLLTVKYSGMWPWRCKPYEFSKCQELSAQLDSITSLKSWAIRATT
jgi:hypothetical protein